MDQSVDTEKWEVCDVACAGSTWCFKRLTHHGGWTSSWKMSPGALEREEVADVRAKTGLWGLCVLHLPLPPSHMVEALSKH